MNRKKIGLRSAALVLAFSMMLPSAGFASAVDLEADVAEKVMVVTEQAEDVLDVQLVTEAEEEIAVVHTDTADHEENDFEEDADFDEDLLSLDAEDEEEIVAAEEDAEGIEEPEAVEEEAVEEPEGQETPEEDIILLEEPEAETPSTEEPKAEAPVAEEPEPEAPAPATAFAYSGAEVTFIGADGNGFGMFSAQEGTEAVLNGDTVEITYVPKNTTVYSGFYYGDINAPEGWNGFVALSDGAMHFTVSKAECGMAYPVAPVKVKDGQTTGSQYYVAIPAADKLKVKEPETPEVPEEPTEEKPEAATAFAYDGAVVTFIAVDGSGFGMLSPQEGTEAVLNGDTVEITYVPKNKTVYAGFYYGDINDEASRTNYVAFAEDGDFTFTVSASACGMAYPVVPIKRKDGETTSTQYYVAIPAVDKLKVKEPEVVYAKSFEVPVTSEGGSMYAAAEGIPAYIAELEDGTFVARITTVNGKADMVAIGEKDDVEKHKVDWYANEGDSDHSVFTIPVASMNSSVVLYFRNLTSGNWSSKGYTYTFAAGEDKKASAVEVTFGEHVEPAVQEEQPEDPGQEEPAPGAEDPTLTQEDPKPGTEEPTKPVEELVQPIDKSVLSILKSDKTEYGMMRITEYTAITDGKNITITFSTNHETYAKKIFFGKVADIASITQAYARAKDDTFTITVPYSAKGKQLPMVIATEKGWKEEQYYIQIPDQVKEVQKPVEEAPQEDNKDITPYKPETPQGTNGTTPAVNNQTALADGSYAPDSFSFAGGTGKLTISCPQVAIRSGKAYATLVFSSGKIIYVKANGATYYPSAQTERSSTYEIPVELNQNNQILACTTAMSQPHEVAYTIYVGLKAGQNAPAKQTGEEVKSESGEMLVYLADAPEIPGLTYEGTKKTETAELYKLHYYKDGFKVLQIDMTEEEAAEEVQADPEEEPSLYEQDTLSYLFVPVDAEIPAGIDKDYIVIEVPVEHAYIASNSVLDQLEDEMLDQVAAIASVENVPEAVGAAVADEKIKAAGGIADVDYKDLLLDEIDLAVVCYEDLKEIALASKEPETEEKDAVREQIVSVGEEMGMLDIPVLIDRSAKEEDEKGQKEWAEIYQVLFGKADAE